MGFGVPILEWFKTDIRDFAREIVLNGKATSSLLARDYIEKLWNQHQAGIRNRATELWVVMMLNLWYERFVEKKLGV